MSKYKSVAARRYSTTASHRRRYVELEGAEVPRERPLLDQPDDPLARPRTALVGQEDFSAGGL
jgi:hypothetical protein